MSQSPTEGEGNEGEDDPQNNEPAGNSDEGSSGEEDIMAAITPEDRARMERELKNIKAQEDQRSRQLKNVREAIKTLGDRLGTESGGVFDGKDPDKCLWYISMVEEVLDLYQIGTPLDACQLLEVDACSILTGCLGGTAQEVLRASKMTDKGLHKDLERLKATIITKFMGDLTQFDLKAKAWASKQKEGECVRSYVNDSKGSSFC